MKLFHINMIWERWHLLVIQVQWRDHMVKKEAAEITKHYCQSDDEGHAHLPPAPIGRYELSITLWYPPPQHTRCFMVCLTLNDHNSLNEHQLFEEDLKLETET